MPADPNKPDEMEKEKKFETFTSSLYYNVYKTPFGKKIKDFCLNSCRPHMKFIVTSILKSLAAMEKKVPNYFYGNLNSENIYYADDKKVVTIDNLMNNHLDENGVSTDTSHNKKTDFVDLAKLILEMVIKTPKKDVSFVKNSVNPIQLLREVYKEDDLDENKPIDTELGVSLSFSTAKNDADKMAAMGESIYDLISKYSLFNKRLLGKTQNDQNKDEQFPTAEKALAHPYLSKEISILTFPSDVPSS